MNNIVLFIIIYFLTSLSMQFLIKVAKKYDIQEHPNPNLERKIHKEPKAYTASVGIFFIFWGSVVAFSFIKGEWAIPPLVIFGAFLLFFVSFLDDYFKIKGKSFSITIRFAVHIIAALIVYSQGIEFSVITNPFTSQVLVLNGWLGFMLTVLWVVGLINVINFIDGIDGLAGGVCAIVASTLLIVALSQGASTMTVLTIILLAICIGYVRYNRYPSRILMGDSGATALGYIIAILSLVGIFKQATFISVIVPVMALGVPIVDNIVVVIRRILRKQAPYQADDTQIHYRLRKMGLHDRFVTAFLLLITSVLSLASLVLYFAVNS